MVDIRLARENRNQVSPVPRKRLEGTGRSRSAVVIFFRNVAITLRVMSVHRLERDGHIVAASPRKEL